MSTLFLYFYLIILFSKYSDIYSLIIVLISYNFQIIHACVQLKSLFFTFVSSFIFLSLPLKPAATSSVAAYFSNFYFSLQKFLCHYFTVTLTVTFFFPLSFARSIIFAFPFCFAVINPSWSTDTVLELLLLNFKFRFVA